jgi:HEAT repeat protein
VYTNPKRDDSLAFLLYKDGVGEVTIRERVLDGEIDAFVRIITEESAAVVHSDEDVVTRLWNADFDHVSYRVIDDYLAADPDASDGDEVVDVRDQVELRPSLEDKGRVIVRPGDPIESIDGYLRGLIMENCAASDEAEREAYFQDMVESFFRQDPADRERYFNERETEMNDDGLAAFAETILVFTLLQENPSAVRDISGVIERVVEYVIADRDPRTLVRLIELLRGFRAGQNLPEGVAALCDRMEAALSDPALVQSFETELERWSSSTEYVLSYFKCIGRPVVDPLLKLLHRVEGGRLHREICQVLIHAAGPDIETLLERMDIDNGEVARDAVFIASRIQWKSVTPRIQELLSYPDRKIRSDTLELIGTIDDPAVPELFLTAAHDPDKEIRCKALLVAAGRGYPQVSGYLSQVAFGKEVQDKDPDEQEAIFKALGYVGDSVVVESLRRMVEKRRLMDFTGNRENKLLAIRALEHIQEPAAVELLEKLGGDSNETVRSRATRALAVLRARMRGVEEEGVS